MRHAGESVWDSMRMKRPAVLLYTFPTPGHIRHWRGAAGKRGLPQDLPVIDPAYNAFVIQ